MVPGVHVRIVADDETIAEPLAQGLVREGIDVTLPRSRSDARRPAIRSPSPDERGPGPAIVAQLVRASGGSCRLDAVPTGGTGAVVGLHSAR